MCAEDQQDGQASSLHTLAKTACTPGQELNDLQPRAGCSILPPAAASPEIKVHKVPSVIQSIQGNQNHRDDIDKESSCAYHYPTT